MSFRTRSFVFASALLLSSGALPGSVPALAQDAQHPLSPLAKLRAAIDRADSVRSAELLDADAQKALSSNPAKLLAMLSASHRCSATHSTADASRAARRRLASTWMLLAAAAREGHPDSPHVPWVVALTHVEQERAAPSPSGEGWSAAGAELRGIDKAAGRSGDARALVYAVNILLEGAYANEKARHALQKAAGVATRRALARKDVDDATVTAVGRAHLWFARVLHKRDRGRAKDALKIALEALEPLADSAPQHASVAAVFNVGVTLDHTAKFALRSRYVTSTHTTLHDTLQLDLPISSRWTITPEPTSDPDMPSASHYVTQTGADGRAVRQILFRSYDWTETYTFADDAVAKGDNVRGLMSGQSTMLAFHVFAPGAKTGKLKKRKLGRGLSSQSLTMEGTSREGTLGDRGATPLRVHVHAVRGEKQKTFVILVYEYGKFEDAGSGTGPEMECVLASLREPEKSER